MMIETRSLEEYESVSRWLLNLSFESTGSSGTKQLYLWILEKFCRFMDENPDELISACRASESARREFAEKIKAFTMDDHRARGTVSTYSFALKSFFKHNGVHIRIGRIKRWVTYEDRAITQEELCKLMEVANLGSKVMIAILAQSGMRIGTLASLTYGHVKEGLDKEEAPLRVHVDAKITKDRVKSFDTFLGPDAIHLLKAYLKARKLGTENIPGEILTDKSPLIRDEVSKDVKGVRAQAIYRRIRDPLLKAGLVKKGEKRSKLRPHSFRKFFKTQMEVAGVSRTFTEYMMGHTLPGSESAYFKPTLNQLREAYMKGLVFLSLSPKTDVEDEFKRVLQILKAKRGEPDIVRIAEKFLEALSEEKVYNEAPSRSYFNNNNNVNFCPKCKNSADSDALVCDQCGEKLRTECEKCKTLNKIGAKYCKKCGEKLTQLGHI